ncbi:MAG: 5'-methylthioadenosine/S-adenosylhomocysteine nucleosidase [Bacilli bacterium]
MELINLVLVAMDSELEALLHTIKNYKMVVVNNEKGYEFSFENEKYLIMMGKIGKVHTAFFLGQLSKCINIKRVFNLGTSGGLNKDLSLDEVIIANKVGYYDVDVTSFGYAYGQVPGCPKYYECDNDYIESHLKNVLTPYRRGIIVSGDQFVNKKNFVSIKPLIEPEMQCIEMESGAVGQTCYLLKIPFIVIRSISDFVFDEDNYKTHNDNVESSTVNSALVFLSLIGMKQNIN